MNPFSSALRPVTPVSSSTVKRHSMGPCSISSGQPVGGYTDAIVCPSTCVCAWGYRRVSSAPSWLSRIRKFTLWLAINCMMLNLEYPTAMQENAKITVVVFDNSASGLHQQPAGLLWRPKSVTATTTGKLNTDYTDFSHTDSEGICTQTAAK